MKRLFLPFVALAMMACDDASIDPHAGLDAAEMADADPMARAQVPENASALTRMHVVGHGMVFDAAGRKVPLTPAFVRQVQEEIYAKVQFNNRLNRLDRTRVASARRAAVRLPAPAQASLMNAVNGKLVSAAPKSVQRDLKWRVAFLARHAQQSDGGEENFALIPQRFRDLQVDLSDFLIPDVILRPKSYVQRCREAGVPIPPVWSQDDPNGWTYHGVLTQNILDPGGTGHLWTWSEGERKGLPLLNVFNRRVATDVSLVRGVNRFPGTITVPQAERGACVLLPRGTTGAGVAGIWCQSARTGNACVWDNIDRASGQMINWSTSTLDVNQMEDGDTLDDNCTRCHKGNNAFLLAPDDPTWAKVIRPTWIGKWRRPNLTTNLDASAGPRFKMISNQPGWGNVAAPSCIGCHERPDVDFAAVPSPMPPNCSTTGTTTAGCYDMP